MGDAGPKQDAMLPWLAQAARELRERAGRKLVNVASSLGASESTVWRFENATGWPERPDLMVAAYADDLEIQPLAIWEHALALWRAATAPGDSRSEAAARLEQELAEAAHKASPRARDSAKRRRASQD